LSIHCLARGDLRLAEAVVAEEAAEEAAEAAVAVAVAVY
jgi:hypothetical protein